MTAAPFEYINQRYLLGISDEPKQLLQPIAGYAREPLLPLEDACEPLITIVPRLKPHIWVAKQNSKNPADGLTQDESAAIRLYTMEWDAGDVEPRDSLYAHLNRTLKQIDRAKLRPWFRYLKLLLTALAKLPSTPRQTVWRGVRKDHSADYPPGTESTWWAFSSCTTSLSVLQSDLYLGNSGTRTLFSIEIFNGRTIRAHSHFQIEDEILLLPGTFFEVKSRLNPAPDLHIIHLNEKRPPFDLLEPPFEALAPINSFLNGSIPDPVSIADAFYAFDNNIFDLYSRRNGEIIGGSVSYVQGYVAYGQAMVLDQSVTTAIQIQPDFNLTTDTSFTIEGFFLLNKTQLYAILVQLTPTITMNLTNGILSLSLGSNIIITGTSVISTDQWHHFAFLYDATQQTASIYIDGTVEATRKSVIPEVVYHKANSLVIVGAGFQGYIDQLSIILKAKSPAAILWDATTAAYYSLDILYLLDKGPNGMNATASNILLIYGWLYNALNFNLSGSNYQASGFIVLGTPRGSFSIALWIRAEAQGGIFFTVANPYTCLLVLSLQNNTNRLIAYLPNAIASGNDVNIFGPIMPFVWVHVAFTWSFENQARLYASVYFQNGDSGATTLNNARGDKNSSPMTITLGYYNGIANCQGIDEIDSSQEFRGSLDEVYVFGRELEQSEIKDLTIPPST